MKTLICPLDGCPCDVDCPDRYTDCAEGGCHLTTAAELGAKILDLGDGLAGMVFSPHGKECTE